MLSPAIGLSTGASLWPTREQSVRASLPTIVAALVPIGNKWALSRMRPLRLAPSLLECGPGAVCAQIKAAAEHSALDPA